MEKGVPILMYHALAENRLDETHPIHIAISSFKEQMRWLKSENYTTISLHQFVNALEQKCQLPEKCVVITFDDGYLSLYDFATPVLIEMDFCATLFLTVAAVGLSSYSAFGMIGLPSDDRPLNWQELKKMVESGWSIQAHGINHFSLPRLSLNEIKTELLESCMTIEKELKIEINFFAYPFGHYNNKVLAIVKNNYRAAFAVHTGLAFRSSDIYRLPRIEINSNDDITSFINKIETGFNSKNQLFKAQIRNFFFKFPILKDIIVFFKGY